MEAVRARIFGAVAVIALASAFGVVALAGTSANGLPSATNGYAKWTRLNTKPFTSTGPLSSAHRGVKNVYASKRRIGKRFPNGTVVVKTIQPAGRTGRPFQVAVMRKTNGRWRYDEYQLSESRYRRLDYPQSLCQNCHASARASDYVFTK
jgi:hypothetical protein